LVVNPEVQGPGDEAPTSESGVFGL
jgi:hypothetical protein